MPISKELWLKVKARLEETLPESQAKDIRSVDFVEGDENRMVLSVRSSYHMSSIEKTCKSNILNLINDESGAPVVVEFIIRDKKTSPVTVEKNTDIQKRKEIKKPESLNKTLSKGYTFDGFIPGENSILAYNAAKAIAMNPGVSFNPLLIYGGVGLGKTHLLQAIGNFMDKKNPNMNIVYVTAESFTNEFIDCLGKKNGTIAFKNKYRNVDCLLIDDIHFLQNKWQTQEELFHTFNDLYNNQKQVVFTCDRPISELTDIKDRLITRFRRGLNADLQPPDYETRVAIANKKCKEKNFPLSKEIIEYVCQNISSNVRDLEGALTTISSFGNLVGKPVTLQIAKEQLKNFIPEPAVKNSNITIDAITREVAKFFNVNEYDIRGRSRNKTTSLARHIAIYLADTLTSYSMTEIGRSLGGMDHTTVHYAIKKVKSQIESDASVKETVKKISEKLV